MTLHRPGPDGWLYCMPCMMRAAMPQQQQQHLALQPHVMPPPQQPPVIQVQQKAGGGVVRSTIDAAKFILSLIFLLCVGTCVYVCGSAADKAGEHSSSRP